MEHKGGKTMTVFFVLGSLALLIMLASIPALVTWAAIWAEDEERKAEENDK